MDTSSLIKVAQAGPDDVGALDRALAAAGIPHRKITGILGKTEGNGCVNDYTRGFATAALRHYLQQFMEMTAVDAVPIIMSGGCEGVISPHLTVFFDVDVPKGQAATGGLRVARGRTRDLEPHEIGTPAMVETVAAAVSAVMRDHGLTKDAVHFAQIKCPLLGSEDIRQSKRPLATTDTLKSMGLSRGAASLGVALALGELSPEVISSTRIGVDLEVFSSVASTSAGIELKYCEILLLGNSPRSCSQFRVGHDVMRHCLDLQAVQRAVRSSQCCESSIDLRRVVQVFAKAEAAPCGEVLGSRHTMLQDSDISPTRMARAVVGAVVAGLTQDPQVYVSGGAEHQGPPGGGPVAVISHMNGGN